MTQTTLNTWLERAAGGGDATLNALQGHAPLLWWNPLRQPFAQVKDALSLGLADIEAAAARLQRFAAYFAVAFPETAAQGGIIESELRPARAGAAAMAHWLGESEVPPRLLIKCDSHLPISGSIKARGGIYEVLLYAEQLAQAAGLLPATDPLPDYACFDSAPFRALFAQHSIAVGSTGNLGLSIGIIGARLGFNVSVHMSADARAWKKALLCSRGVTVVEHSADYSVAVAQGRAEALNTPRCHFIDDEDSTTLFLGYSVAALRLQQQLAAAGIRVDAEQPLIVYLPCGVGGGPGGIAFGLKQVFGDAVHCFFAEPTHSPCMLLGMYTGLHNAICVQDIGLDNLTCADGLAVGRASAFVGRIMEPLLDGIYTVSDEQLYALVKLLRDTEGLALEPSALAGMPGFVRLLQAARAGQGELSVATLQRATHIVWATGGNMVPAAEMADYYRRGEACLAAG